MQLGELHMGKIIIPTVSPAVRLHFCILTQLAPFLHKLICVWLVCTAICDSILDAKKTAEAENLKEVYCKDCHRRYFIENEEIPVPSSIYKTQHQLHVNNERVLSDICQQNNNYSSPIESDMNIAQQNDKNENNHLNPPTAPTFLHLNDRNANAKPSVHTNINVGGQSKELIWSRQANPTKFTPGAKKSSQLLDPPDGYAHPLQSGRPEKQRVSNKRMPLTMRSGPINNRILSPPRMYGPKIRASVLLNALSMPENKKNENATRLESNWALNSSTHMKNVVTKKVKKKKVKAKKSSSYSLLTDAESACFIDPHMMTRPIMVQGRQISMNSGKHDKFYGDSSSRDQSSRFSKQGNSGRYKNSTEECAYISPATMLKLRKRQGLNANNSGFLINTGSEATSCSSNRSLLRADELLNFEIGAAERKSRARNDGFTVSKPEKIKSKKKSQDSKSSPKSKMTLKNVGLSPKERKMDEMMKQFDKTSCERSLAEDTELKNVLECPVCYESLLNMNEGTGLLKETLLTPCGHVFHEECIRGWKDAGYVQLNFKSLFATSDANGTGRDGMINKTRNKGSSSPEWHKI